MSDRVKTQKRDLGFRIADCGLRIGENKNSSLPAPFSPLPAPRSPLHAPRSPLPTPRSPHPAPRSPRRGVLLLVVLSMLVLFMLIGTAFLMTSSQSRDAAKGSAKKNRLGNHATKELGRALLHVLRDTENPHSAVRTHSLLRDFYGTDGFQGVTYRYVPGPPPDKVDLHVSGQTCRFAGATAAQPLGPTQGQMVDIYFKSLTFGVAVAGKSDDDPDTIEPEALLTSPDLRHVLKLDRNVLGQPQIHVLPLTKGYYNGCLLTVTSGPAAGQSARIVDYECVNPLLTTYTRLFRFRVMAFSQRDGLPLQIDLSRPPEIGDLAGATFIVNGRAFNGTGVGYNSLAATGQARLTALQQMTDGTNVVGAEVALTPNAAYLDFALVAMHNPSLGPNPFAAGFAATDFLLLNPQLPLLPPNPTPMQLAAHAAVLAQWKYPSHTGPGDADESYDAADFQNMFLALLTVTPRAQGRVVTDQPGIYSADEFLTNPQGNFLRLDLEDLPLPSFHRPDLVNFWYHRLLMLISNGTPSDAHVLAVLQPYGRDGYREGDPNDSGDDPTAIPIAQRDLVAAIKRKIMLRPIREDHPKFDGGNPQSVPAIAGGSNLVVGGNIAIPYWEVVGPWDVDNDNDGVADSVWVDVGNPIIELEDGTRYKTLVSYLIIDLDSRLNVNAHGLADHINPPNLAYAEDVNGNPSTFNLASGFSSNAVAQGVGYGPAEISLRPIFPKPWTNAAGTQFLEGNRWEDSDADGDIDIDDFPIDSYATLLAGRVESDATAVPGKYGYLQVMTDQQRVTAGMNYDYTLWQLPASPTGDTARPDLAAQIKFFDYPWVLSQQSAFGTPPDLFGRYGLGIDYQGQPVYEVLNDVNPATQSLPPAQWRANHLLANSPYELDLSSGQRRDTWASNFPDAATAFSQSLSQNDDAPFATTDLERVLRAWDADSGTLPSRLWDVVDAFDPIKLMTYDQYRVTGIANAVFGSSGGPERLTAAQQVAAINRRLVTTDSVDPPVASVSPPAYMLTVPEGVDPAFKAAYEQYIKRKPPGSMSEMLELRIRRAFASAGWPPTPFDDYDPNGDHDLDGMLNAVDPEYSDPTVVQNRLVRAARINAIINGGTWTDSSGVHFESRILAPDLMAGKRLDLNRPFGDGRDNAGDGFDNDGDGFIDEPADGTDPFNMANGVVDDPLEAGDPFLDVNGNGKRDNDSVVPPNGEPFVDLDGSGGYSPPRDQLWADLTLSGNIAESIAFDHTNGHEDPTHPTVAAAVATTLNMPVVGGVRSLESQARQLYARHLYCLMLLLVDENYIAPHDENDPQTKEYLDFKITNSLAANVHAALTAASHPNPDQETRRIMLRKLTMRTIAQWAVNCVDMRDADVIMTPFEYDENPWDGWGCVDRDGVNIPLDGDAATDENGDLTATPPTATVLDWNTIGAGGSKATMPVPAPATALDQTRGLVWGAERPELLITETLGLHDRRTEDTGTDLTKKQMTNPDDPANSDEDLDQRLRPKGSLFVELYNPWSPSGQYPAELYRYHDGSVHTVTVNNQPIQFEGVLLNRLSNLAVDANGNLTAAPSNATNGVKRSPVWRMVVVEEHPAYRQLPVDDQFDNQPDQLGTGVHTGPPSSRYSGFFESADPDRGSRFFYGQEKPATGKFPDNEPYVERSIYFTSDNAERFKRNDPTDPSGASENFLSVKPTLVDNKLRLPPESPQSARYFIAANFRDPNASTDGIDDVPIAPIKPGRYAVVGTAGAQYWKSDAQGLRELLKVQRYDEAGNNIVTETGPRFGTTISRLLTGQGGTAKFETDDTWHVSNFDRTRRIELLPSPNPEMQQILVAANGGTPLFPNDPNLPQFIRRDNEVAKRPDGEFRNIYAGRTDPANAPYTPYPDTNLIPPCVAIPIKDMSVSEPLDLYVGRRKTLDADEKALEDADTTGTIQLLSHYYNPEAGNGDGAFIGEQFPPAHMQGTTQTPYDEPFDLAPELRRNGTTRNYRTIHLQRLADPTLPWNPLPKLPDGKDNPQHDPKLPVNVYRTIDTSSVDLTAFNGASSREPVDTSGARREHRWLPENQSEFEKMYGPYGAAGDPRDWIHLKSLERGAHASDQTTAGNLALVPRALWRQEPINRVHPVPSNPQNDMLTWMRIDPNDPLNPPDQQRTNELKRRANDLRLRDRDQLERDITAIAGDNVLDDDNAYDNYPAALKPGPAHFDIMLDHSLGFQNESFGALASRDDVIQMGLPVAADGKPMADTPDFTRITPPPDSPITATHPWLAWGNRPYVSAEELLQVPATSSSQMLRQFSTINSNVPPANQPNPYNGLGLSTVPERLVLFQSPFGHLLNMFLTSPVPAYSGPDTADLDGDGDNTELITTGAPHFYRILEYVQVPSRYVGTDTLLNAERFSDNPLVVDPPGIVDDDITGPSDPRYFFQPPFNKVSRERDPGRVNLNTVTGRRVPPVTGSVSGPATIWSEVYDGIMHTQKDGWNPATGPLGHFGPAWRDVVLSRRGYAQVDAAGASVDKPPPAANPNQYPDVFAMGLNNSFPTVFANPFRSPDAGDLVPLVQMMQYGVDASFQRVHPYNPAANLTWGPGSVLLGARAAGFDDDALSYRGNGAIPNDDFTQRGIMPLFSDSLDQPWADTNRNPYMMYQPMTRLGNLVTNRSGVFAIWITVGYFEVEPAPNWNDPGVSDRFNGDINLYNRVYPDGYMLGREVGSDTGDVKRPRGFYIVDRTEEVGFKPGEDLNVERMIRLRRRIE